MISNFLRALRMPSVLLGALGLAALLCAGAGFLLTFFPLGGSTGGMPTAALTIFPAATSTPVLPTATATLLSGPEGAPTPLPGEIGIGSFVQIVGTEGNALNIRVAPGLSAEVFFLAYEDEVFVVRDGPQEADGFVWWYVVTPVDETRAGWAAGAYLSVVANP